MILPSVSTVAVPFTGGFTIETEAGFNFLPKLPTLSFSRVNNLTALPGSVLAISVLATGGLIALGSSTLIIKSTVSQGMPTERKP